MNNKNIFIGSLVSVIDDVIKGIVVSMENNVISIEDENGFIFKFHPSELIKIENNIHLDEQKIDQNQFKEKYESYQVKNGIKSKKQQENKKNEALEVDLHIHQITHSNARMSNHDMLTIQLETAKNKLEYAIKNNIQSIVFIHGVGKGKLKAELYYLLKKYPVKINDASFQKYGYGATEIYIYKNAKTNQL